MTLRVMVLLENQLLKEALCHYLKGVMPDVEVSGNLYTKGRQNDIVLIHACALLNNPKEMFDGYKVVVMDCGLSLPRIEKIFLQRDVVGIISPDCDAHLFVKALHCVARGELWLDHQTTKSLVRLKRREDVALTAPYLTKTEKKIVELILQGYKNKEIADAISLSESTVKAHCGKIYKKYQVGRRAELLGRLLKNSGLEGADDTSEG